MVLILGEVVIVLFGSTCFSFLAIFLVTMVVLGLIGVCLVCFVFNRDSVDPFLVFVFDERSFAEKGFILVSILGKNCFRSSSKYKMNLRVGNKN